METLCVIPMAPTIHPSSCMQTPHLVPLSYCDHGTPKQ